jgi:hypothetical protein
VRRAREGGEEEMVRVWKEEEEKRVYCAMQSRVSRVRTEKEGGINL